MLPIIITAVFIRGTIRGITAVGIARGITILGIPLGITAAGTAGIALGIMVAGTILGTMEDITAVTMAVATTVADITVIIIPERITIAAITLRAVEIMAEAEAADEVALLLPEEMRILRDAVAVQAVPMAFLLVKAALRCAVPADGPHLPVQV